MPPTLKGSEAEQALKQILAQSEHTFGAQVDLITADIGNGFDAPKLPPAIEDKLNQVTQEVFG